MVASADYAKKQKKKNIKDRYVGRVGKFGKLNNNKPTKITHTFISKLFLDSNK